MGLFTRDFTGNHVLELANKLGFETVRKGFWGKWVKYTTPKGKPVVDGNIMPKVTDSPIAVHRELQRRAGDELEIPMFRRLTSKPTYGKNQLKDHEEEAKVNYARVPIDILRHAMLQQDGIMSTHTTKDIDVIRNAYPLLENHYGEVLENEVFSHALYYGFSKNILTSSRFSGNSRIKAISHPHIFVKGDGKVAHTNPPGTTGYETAVGTAIDTLGTSDLFNVAFLQYLKVQPEVLRLAPLVMKDGNRLRLIVAHPYQIAALENDSDFKTLISQQWAHAYAKESPYLVGAKYVWGGFAIYESDVAAWKVSTSGGVPVWGPVAGATEVSDLTDYEDYSSATKFAAPILGKSALLRATGSAMRFKGREDDFGEIKALSYRDVEGASRADYWNEDDGTRGDAIINTGSVLACTYAAQPSA